MRDVERARSAKPLRLLLVHSSDELYGSDLALLTWVRHLTRHPVQVCVVLPSDRRYSGELSQELRRCGVDVYHLPVAVLRRGLTTPVGALRYLGQLVLSTVLLSRLIVQREVSVVHTSTLAVLPGAVAAALLGRTHVWHVLEIIRKPGWLARVYRWVVPRLSDVVIAVSGPSRTNLLGLSQSAHHAAKTRVVWLGRPFPSTTMSALEREQTRQTFGADNRVVLVGVVGRISAWKGQAAFLRAAARVHRTHPDVRYVVVGGAIPGRPGDLAGLRRLAGDLDLAEVACITGYRPNAAALMAALDVLVVPSVEPEPFGLVVLEGMAAAVPVIAFAHGGPTEIIAHEVTGLLVERVDELALACAIRRLVEDPDARLRMGQAGRDRALRQFGVEQFVQGMEAAYQLAGVSLVPCERAPE